jgi:hypothetical protein
MRYFSAFETFVGIAAILTALLCRGASGQDPQSKAAPVPVKGVQVIDAPPIPVRASPTEYHAHAAAGAVTVAAEFTGHSVATPLASFTTEDYVAVEVALFGQPGARLRLSHEDFSLSVNGKKAVPAQLYLLLSKSLKDPEYVPPEPTKSKDDAGVPIAGHSSDRNPEWHPIPFAVTHAMETRVEKAALPEGDRPLPAAGLIFFPYKGRDNGISTVELIYNGPAGKASLTLNR